MTSSHRDLPRMIAAAALGGAAVAIAACGSTASPGAAPAPTKTVTVPASQPASTATATPTTSATPTPAGPQPCPTSALKSSVGTGNGAAGSTYYPLEFTNVSGAACTLFGYPGVSFVTGTGGSQIGGAASRNPAVTSQLVTLAPGSTAHATLQVVNAMNYPGAECHLVTAHTIKIFPPNQTAPIYLSFTAPACSSRAKAVHILAVEAVQRGDGSG
jgi:Protein of unknown function (DUF4232)